jgi:nucleoside 2-deoxyribosyltransferase
MTPRVYLAGPDVFLREPMAAAERKKELCQAYGFEGVFPLDAELDLGALEPRAAGLAISRANERLIRDCQLLIAQVTPFRGPSADVGTAFEMGFARALGLPVYAYTNVASDFTTRTREFVRTVRARTNRVIEDQDGMEIENFGLADNLMLVGAVEHSGGKLVSFDAPANARFTGLEAFQECLRLAKRDL